MNSGIDNNLARCNWMVGLLALVGFAAMARADSVDLELSAGKHDRSDTPVFFDLPQAMRSWKAVELIDIAANKPVAVQLDASDPPRLIWILDEPLKAGATKRYRLSEKTNGGAEASAVKVEHDEKALRIIVDGKPLLQYNIAVVPSDDPKEPAYARSGFIHPVYDPAGNVVTDGMPPDHMHQHGLMFAWVNTTFEGRRVDFWNSYSHQGLIRHVKLLSTASGPVFGAFTATLNHVDLTAPGGEKVALHETWTIHAYRHAGGFLFDLQSIQTCASQSPLQINKNIYGGMEIRGSRDWFGPGKCNFLTSDGKDTIAGNQTRARWCDMFGPAGGQTSGITVFSHPSNFDSPQPLRLHPEKPYFCWAPMITGPFTITPAKPYISNYRFHIHTGKPNPAIADALDTDYANAPQVKVAGR